MVVSYNLYLKDGTLPLDSITSSKCIGSLQKLFRSILQHGINSAPCFRIAVILIGMCQIPHVVTLDTKTRIFQYKLLNRIIYTSKSLYKMKMVESPLCPFCKISDESLEHHFCRCDFIAAFWTSVVLWLKSLHITIDSLNDSDIIFGLTQKRSHWLLLRAH